MHGVSGAILEMEEMTQTRPPPSVHELASEWFDGVPRDEPAITCCRAGWVYEIPSRVTGKASAFVGEEQESLPPKPLGICRWDRRTFRSECS